MCYVYEQNKERTDRIGRISLFCWMGASFCTVLVEVCSFDSVNDSIIRVLKFSVRTMSAWRDRKAIRCNEEGGEGS